MKKIKWFLVILLSLLLVIPPNALAEIVGTITYTEGRVDKLEAGGKGYVPVIAGDKVSSGDAIRTKSYSKAEITFDDDSIVRLGGSSQIKVKEYDIDELGQRKKGVIELDRGRIRAIVSSTKDKTPFDINTLNASGSVKGSDVFVSYQKSATGILVLDGALRTVNPAFPDNVINIREGNASFVPYDAPPQNPRTYLPMEKQRYELETGPTIREIEGMLEGEEITHASVRRIAGVVKIQPADSESWHAPIINEVLNVGDKVATESDGRIEISLDNGHILELKPNTQIILTILTVNPKTGDYENEFECGSGKVIAKLRKIEGKSSFMIKTPTATCGVRGTLMYVEVLPNLTKVFFEGGDGFITSLVSGITKIVNAGQTGSGDNTGNVTDPTDTTDEERSKFGSGWGDEGGDTYGYTPPPGDVGGDLTGPGFTVGGTTPDPGTGGGWQPFDIVKPNESGSGGGTGETVTSTNITAGFEGKFGYYDSPDGDPTNEITGTLFSAATAAPWVSSFYPDPNPIIFTGSASNPEGSDLFWGEVAGSGDDGGNIYGRMVGSGSDPGYWQSVIAALYIDSSGVAGTIFGNDLLGVHDYGEPEILYGSGNIFYTPISMPGILPQDLEDSLNPPEEIEKCFDFSLNEGEGYVDISGIENRISIKGESWGISEGIYSGDYDREPDQSEWTGYYAECYGEYNGLPRSIPINGEGLLNGYGDFRGGYGITTVSGEDNLDGFLRMDILNASIDYYNLSGYYGTIMGTYDYAESYYFEGVGAGGWFYEPLAFVSEIDGFYYSFRFDEEVPEIIWDNEPLFNFYLGELFDINANFILGEGYLGLLFGEEAYLGFTFGEAMEGLVGGIDSLWSNDSSDVTLIGRWFADDDRPSHIWMSRIYSINNGYETYTTLEGEGSAGTYFGYIVGSHRESEIEGLMGALCVYPDGSAGRVSGDFFGPAFSELSEGKDEEESGAFIMQGQLNATLIDAAAVTGISPEEVDSLWLPDFIEEAALLGLGLYTDIDFAASEPLSDDFNVLAGLMLAEGFNFEEANWGIWVSAFIGGFAGSNDPFALWEQLPFTGLVVKGSIFDLVSYVMNGDLSIEDVEMINAYYIGAILGSEWTKNGRIAGGFDGIWLSAWPGENNGIVWGMLSGEVVGNNDYIDIDEDFVVGTWQAAGAGEWLEVEELLDLADLTSHIEDMTAFDLVSIPITETALVGTGHGGIASASMDIALYAHESAMTGVWAALISGTYNDLNPMDEDWGISFDTGADSSIDIHGIEWSNGEWFAGVTGQIDENLLAGTAAGTYENGSFNGVGAGVWINEDVADAVGDIIDDGFFDE